MTSNIEELLKVVKSVSVAGASLRKKEVRALAQHIEPEEKPILLCTGAEVKIVLTSKNLFIIASRLIRTAKVRVITLTSIQSAQEKRGILLARITFTTSDGTVKIWNLNKQASLVIMNSLKDRRNIEILPVKTSGILEVTCKLAVTALLVFILKDITCGNVKSDISDNSQSVQAERASFTPVYRVVEDEDLTLFGVPRFKRVIYLPLGLDKETLSLNLRDAAWELQKEKNAVAAVIFAYREDDLRRDGGFTAGKCTVAPFGYWAKAVEVR